jgi:Glyoxalase/Bleomycin resistance protein/Dioxygenase superfamily
VIIEGKHYQNAYITRNIDKAVADFKSKAHVRAHMQYEGSTEVTTPAGRGTQTNKLAFLWVEDLQYEFIQPGPGIVEIYRAELPADDSLKFHHICMRVDDWGDFRARVDKQPLPVVLEGGNEQLRFLYLDARQLLGHYLEYTWMNAQRWAQLGGR